MPQKKFNEKRQYDRYETDVKIDFYVSFDVRTKIDFRVKDPKQGKLSPQKYSAISKNISVEGLSFTSEKPLEKGDGLMLDVFIPSASQPISMEGYVRWCRKLPSTPERTQIFESGVKLINVNGDSVEKSIFKDPVTHVAWSIALESVFGNFKHLVLKDPKKFSVLASQFNSSLKKS